MEKAGWKNWSEVEMAAADRDGWWDCVEALCATWHEEDRWQVTGSVKQNYFHSQLAGLGKKRGETVKLTCFGLLNVESKFGTTATDTTLGQIIYRILRASRP